MSSMELQNTVKEALNALYHHPDDSVRMQADRWLQDFQRTIDAWQVSDNLLHDASSNLETQIFCSQTLRSKVQRDYEELPSEAFRPLRDSLNISIAVAALAVHVPVEDWGGGGVVNWLMDEMNSHPECVPSFLELLTVLPEEAFNYKIAARPERRRQFEKELISTVEVALSILTACLSANELKEQVLEAFASWLRLKHEYTLSILLIPASTLASHPLVLTALSSLNSDLLSEAAVNVISELIHYTAAGSSGGLSEQMPLIQVLVPQVMSLKEQLRDSSKDEEDVKAVVRLFADMGDSYVELIATGSDESLLIVHALLDVVSHPEHDIALMTFNFWHNLQVLSKDYLWLLLIVEGSPAQVSFRVEYPQDYHEISREDLKDFKQTRHVFDGGELVVPAFGEVKETYRDSTSTTLTESMVLPAVANILTDAASVLGGEATLKILYMKLVKAVGGCRNDEPCEWGPAEAALYCIRAVSNYVPVVETEVMHQHNAMLPCLYASALDVNFVKLLHPTAIVRPIALGLWLKIFLYTTLFGSATVMSIHPGGTYASDHADNSQLLADEKLPSLSNTYFRLQRIEFQEQSSTQFSFDLKGNSALISFNSGRGDDGRALDSNIFSHSAEFDIPPSIPLPDYQLLLTLLLHPKHLPHLFKYTNARQKLVRWPKDWEIEAIDYKELGPFSATDNVNRLTTKKEGACCSVAMCSIEIVVSPPNQNVGKASEDKHISPTLNRSSAADASGLHHGEGFLELRGGLASKLDVVKDPIRVLAKKGAWSDYKAWLEKKADFCTMGLEKQSVSSCQRGGIVDNLIYSREVTEASLELLQRHASISSFVSISSGYESVRYVDERGLKREVMAVLPNLPHQPQLLQTVCLTIGAYSKWLDAAPSGFSILPSVIEILMSGMSTSEESAAAAALAFRHICDGLIFKFMNNKRMFELTLDCRKKLCGSLDGLFHIYHRAVSEEGGYKVSDEDSLNLVDSLSMVITELPPDHAKKALEALCLPVVTPLQVVINQGPGPLQQILARELIIHIDRLANIFRYVNHPEAVADAIQRLWPIFKAIFDQRAWDMRTMESLCRACKYAWQIFGSDISCANYLKSLIEALFSHTTHLLTKIQDFTARPDIADDCFLLASRCIRYCPHLFIPSAVFPSLVDCSMIGITIQHREACISILTFLSDSFDLANSSRGDQYQSIRDSVILPRGSNLTRILIASLTGALPSSRLEVVTYALLALTRAYKGKALEWAKESVSLIPMAAVTEVERVRFLQALSNAAAGADIKVVPVPVEELSDVCRRNRTVQEIVQLALRPLELNITPVS
ncbi:hypothetical protein HHK36_015235 [Tetracentron sinense]|uniref:Uncharacterized protein n=1 Tax=Tetracentron sinense TaxID=13715 RepID=A0A834Z4M7_TETSI|nr:hypothetical protein HHK36_015235 [Tetracentron sinense]